MNILFTRGNNPVSSMIMGLTKEPVSHVAIELDGFVIHCSLLGTKVVKSIDFRMHCTVVYCVAMDRYKLSKVLAMLYKKPMYDYTGLMYLGLRYGLKRVFGWSIPKANLWQVSGMTICTEFVTQIIDEKQDSLITPYRLYKRLINVE
jgi:hypothetical protein